MATKAGPALMGVATSPMKKARREGAGSSFEHRGSCINGTIGHGLACPRPHCRLQFSQLANGAPVESCRTCNIAVEVAQLRNEYGADRFTRT